MYTWQPGFRDYKRHPAVIPNAKPNYNNDIPKKETLSLMLTQIVTSEDHKSDK